jgi:O-methyltransferase involved in polyketide biosynthesis
MVEAIEWDFRRFNQSRRVVGASVRTAMIDDWVRDFLQRHPRGTVVELGAGLNSRFERLDNGAAHWFDVDLPDTMALRRRFFTDTERRTTLAASVLDPSWISAVRASPGPWFFAAEGVFIYFEQQAVKAALAQIAANFPGAAIAFDSGNRWAIDHVNRDHARARLDARLAWACEDPAEIERWEIGLRLVEFHTMTDIPDRLRSRLSLPMRAAYRAVAALLPKVDRSYRLSLFAAPPPG